LLHESPRAPPVTQDGNEVAFWSDVLKDRVVLVSTSSHALHGRFDADRKGRGGRSLRAQPVQPRAPRPDQSILVGGLARIRGFRAEAADKIPSRLLRSRGFAWAPHRRLPAEGAVAT
jgi:hypothetical protein